jgi:hypothetical protein
MATVLLAIHDTIPLLSFARTLRSGGFELGFDSASGALLVSQPALMSEPAPVASAAAVAAPKKLEKRVARSSTTKSPGSKARTRGRSVRKLA